MEKAVGALSNQSDIETLDIGGSNSYFLTGFFSHIKITGLAMKIVE
jgi:hypothetical protein